jgi:hypothetical protein
VAASQRWTRPHTVGLLLADLEPHRLKAAFGNGAVAPLAIYFRAKIMHRPKPKMLLGMG